MRLLNLFSATVAATSILVSSSTFAQTQMGGVWQFMKNEEGGVVGWKGSSASEEFAGPVIVCHRAAKTLEVSVDLPETTKAGTHVQATLSRSGATIKISGVTEDGISGPMFSNTIPLTGASKFLQADGDLTVDVSGTGQFVYHDTKSALQFRRFVKGCL